MEIQKTMEYSPVGDIDFTSAKRKKAQLEKSLSTAANAPATPVIPAKSPDGTSAPTAEQKVEFFSNLQSIYPKSAILSLISPHSQAFVHTTCPDLPAPLTDLLSEKNLTISRSAVTDICERTVISISKEQAAAVEEATRSQARCSTWFVHRAGRITASKAYSVCHRDTTKKSVSLIKQVCYPETFTFKTAATEWGINQEPAAILKYISSLSSSHESVSVSEAGFVINPLFPFMGASPDGFTQCDCCGKGVLEVKCPYTHCHKSLRSAAEDANFCLEKANDGFSLKRSHQYYYQVQVQIAVCDVEYGDFCVCLFSDSDADGLHIERIMCDEAFWSKCLPKVSDFFNTSVLPELVGKLSTSSSARLSDPACPPLSA